MVFVKFSVQPFGAGKFLWRDGLLADVLYRIIVKLNYFRNFRIGLILSAFLGRRSSSEAKQQHSSAQLLLQVSSKCVEPHCSKDRK